MFNPDGYVDGNVEDEPQDPVCEPHGAFARRGVRVRLEQAAQALKQHERPHDLQWPFGMPEPQRPPPEERAGYRGNVEVGEVVVRDLEGRSIVEQLIDGRRVLRRWLLPAPWRRRTRAVGQEAGAQGGDSLYDQYLVSRAGQFGAEAAGRCLDTRSDAAR